MEAIQSLSSNQLIKLSHCSLAEICSRFKISDKALVLLKQFQTADTFIDALMKDQLFSDAVNFIAHGLPRREAIWWGYLSAAQSEKNSTCANAIQALHLAKKWIYTLNEDVRRELEILAEKLEFKTASGWVAMSVFWSGGSLTAVGVPEVMPSPFLYAKAVAGAVMLAVVLNQPEKSEENYKLFLNQGIDIASGGKGLKE